MEFEPNERPQQNEPVQQYQPKKNGTQNNKILTGILVSVLVMIIIVIILSLRNQGEPIVIEPEEKQGDDFVLPENASPITGVACDNFQKRPIAVMYTGDKGAREYFSNLSLADFVLEMPHRPMHGQPRLMGVFQCNTPELVGPMRSGRTDHISVAGSLDAIYVPWGGSSVGKALLQKGVIDHIDCNGEVAPGGGNACFRREGPMSTLEKASSSIPDLIKIAEQVGYRKEAQTQSFPHQADLPREQRPEYARVRVKFEEPSDVEYYYDPETNAYLRNFHGDPDFDYATGFQYAPKNLITIITKKDAWLTDTNYAELGLQNPWDGIDEEHQLRDSGQYPNLQLGDPWFDVKFEGEAEFFFNGQHIEGIWKRKKGLANRFEFYDQSGKEVRFVPGQIWMHILGHARKVSYETEEERQEREEAETNDTINQELVQ